MTLRQALEALERQRASLNRARSGSSRRRTFVAEPEDRTRPHGARRSHPAAPCGRDIRRRRAGVLVVALAEGAGRGRARRTRSAVRRGGTACSRSSGSGSPTACRWRSNGRSSPRARSPRVARTIRVAGFALRCSSSGRTGGAPRRSAVERLEPVLWRRRRRTPNRSASSRARRSCWSNGPRSDADGRRSGVRALRPLLRGDRTRRWLVESADHADRGTWVESTLPSALPRPRRPDEVGRARRRHRRRGRRSVDPSTG